MDGVQKTFLAIFIFIALLMTIFGSTGSSGKTSWSKLSERERENARWAYAVQQEINRR